MTQNFQSLTLKLKPQTQNPKLLTLNSKPFTLNANPNPNSTPSNLTNPRTIYNFSTGALGSRPWMCTGTWEYPEPNPYG